MRMFKKEKNRCATLADFKVPHEIQPGEYSKGSGADDAAYKWLWAVNANWNGDGWDVEANSISNPNSWNAGVEFVSRYSLLPRSTFSVGRVFCKQTLAPATYHFSYFFDTWCELEILILLYHR